MNKVKIIRFLVIFFLLVFQMLFIGGILLEQYKINIGYKWLLMILIIILLLITYKKIPIHHEEHEIEDLEVAAAVPLGALMCYLISTRLHTGPVIAAGSIGTLASFLPNIKYQSQLLHQMPAAIYCGCFVGMSSIEIAPNIIFILLAGAMAGLFLLLAKNLYLGIGGKLGTIAFVAVNIISFVYYLFVK